ncbi:MAG: phage holin [Oscillospiraceae bacterium]|nr:phage holin [Oscillospiraceae bacterium]
MKINWKVRLKNPVFWVQIAAALFVPILAYFGLSWEDMTTWGAIAEVLKRAVQNPVVLLSAGVSVFNAVTDPTTCGICDSSRAMTYTTPSKDSEKV